MSAAKRNSWNSCTYGPSTSWPCTSWIGRAPGWWKLLVGFYAASTMGACSSGEPAADGSGAGGGTSSGASSAGGQVGAGGAVGPSGGSALGGGASLGGNPSGGGVAVGGSDSGAAPGVGGVSQSVGGAPTPRDCDSDSPALAVELVAAESVGALGAPFPTDSGDNAGPTSWEARYGKPPEIIAVPDGGALAVLWQDQTSGETAHLARIVPAGASYQLDAAYSVQSLGRIMGLTLDEAGNYYVATGVDEDAEVDATYPPNEIHRPDIVRIVKFDRSGCVLMESDVDMARGAADDMSEIIVNPMVAGSSRLAYGAGQLGLIHSHNTEPDPDLDGTRHQKAIATHVDAMTGEVTRASTLWVSHSFDQRLFFDGTGFVELHLGDAYPRTLTAGRFLGPGQGPSSDLFHIKGPLGDNKTFTRLGGIVPIADPDFGYLVLFATERTTSFDAEGEVNGTRDLALLRVRKDLAIVGGSAVDTGEGTTAFAVSSSGEDQENHLRWLTTLGEDRHVERPRLVALGGEESIALWEEWSVNGNRSTFEGVFALRLASSGEVLAGPLALPEKHHISRGDDAVLLGGRALYVGGSEDGGLALHFVGPDLSFERVVIP